MHFKGLLVSETCDIDSMVSILEGYFENISHDERIDKGYPTKIVWVNCENILDEMNDGDGTKTRRDLIMKLLPCGYDYVTPEVLESRYGIKTDKPQFGCHHEVFNVFDWYNICDVDSEFRGRGLLCKDGLRRGTAKIKDVYFEHNENDKDYIEIINNEYLQYIDEFEKGKIINPKGPMTFDEFTEIYKENKPAILINGIDWTKSDYYDDFSDNRTEKQKYDDFIKAIKELNPELYITIIDFHC